jgi:hypothetical protein
MKFAIVVEYVNASPPPTLILHSDLSFLIKECGKRVKGNTSCAKFTARITIFDCTDGTCLGDELLSIRFPESK